MDIAVDAIRSAASPHRFLGVNHVGLAAITKTSGNDTCHVILRGGKTGPNYDAEHVRAVKETLAAHKLPEKIMVDCSHGNSLKDFRNQRKVVRSLVCHCVHVCVHCLRGCTARVCTAFVQESSYFYSYIAPPSASRLLVANTRCLA